MSAVAALGPAEAAGVRLSLGPDGRMRMEAATAPPAEVLAGLRQHREDVAHILAARQALTVRDSAAAKAAPAAVEARKDFGRPIPEAEHRAVIAGFLAAARQRPPAWSELTDRPSLGAWCSCCGRFTRAGGRWWCEAVAPKGWRCCICHPAPPGLAVVEVMT